MRQPHGEIQQVLVAVGALGEFGGPHSGVIPAAQAVVSAHAKAGGLLIQLQGSSIIRKTDGISYNIRKLTVYLGITGYQSGGSPDIRNAEWAVNVPEAKVSWPLL